MFDHRIEPRLSETDGLGHINNTALPAWFEEARKGVFRIFNPTLSLRSWNLILRKLEIEFVAQIAHDAVVDIRTSIDKIGTTSFTVRQVATQDGTEVAIGRAVLIHFDYAAQQPAPISDRIRRHLEEHLEPG